MQQNLVLMSVWRVILSVLFPPLAVYDKGCGSILIVLILTLLGWIPGVIAALIILIQLQITSENVSIISAEPHQG